MLRETLPAIQSLRLLHGVLALTLIAVGSGPALCARAKKPAAPETHALLINGGSRPSINFQSHLHHLEDMVQLLESRGIPPERIHIFSADGEDEAADLAVRDPRSSGFWLIEGTNLGRRLRPRTELTNTVWDGRYLRPASRDALEKWFGATGKILKPDDRLLIFVTDHGTANEDDPDNGAISLWEEQLTVEELGTMVSGLPPGVQSVMVMSQCYSGSFASIIHAEESGVPTGDTCGFFSTRRDLQAYGCYPEGRDRDRIGHAFHFIDALGRNATTSEAHRAVLFTDDTPDVPLSTSDLYLERVLSTESESRGLELDGLVDALLAEAWNDRASWEPEIRLLDRIGEAFGMFSPRSLAEVNDAYTELSALVERMKTFAERWKATLTAVRSENLNHFVETREDWRKKLGPDALEKLNADAKQELLQELLPQLESYTRERPEQWERIDSLRERAVAASQARWRLDTRKAATQRMRTILVGVAGRVLLASERQTAALQAQRAAYDALIVCEALQPGLLGATALVATAPTVRPFPPLADELQLLEQILPSWLGVRFRNVPTTLAQERELLAGAAWLDAVFPDSPASDAGLEAGDVVLGPPDDLFDAQGQLREWTMTSPRDTPLPLTVVRPGETVASDVTFEVTLRLEQLPVEWPELPGPPRIGEVAPRLAGSLKPVGGAEPPETDDRPSLVFFWATWCGPCKRAVPEIRAYAEDRGLSVVAITDEPAETVDDFLAKREDGFFDHVLIDPQRRSFIAFGVSGTPTIFVIDEKRVIRHQQVGYSPDKGLQVPGWSWSGGE